MITHPIKPFADSELTGLKVDIAKKTTLNSEREREREREREEQEEDHMLCWLVFKNRKLQFFFTSYRTCSVALNKEKSAQVIKTSIQLQCKRLCVLIHNFRASDDITVCGYQIRWHIRNAGFASRTHTHKNHSAHNLSTPPLQTQQIPVSNTP